MAESQMNIETREEVLLRGQTIQAELQTAKKDDDSGDDYSSGSDRSYDADDIDDGRGDSGSSGTRDHPDIVASRRKKRHGSHGNRRHKGGSRHKHKNFQPYPMKDDLENTLKRKSLELKEKENAAAVLRQEGVGEQFITFPVAPFNSTQFLMDEHSCRSPAGLHKTPSSSKLTLYSPRIDPLFSSVPAVPREELMDSVNLERRDKEFADIYSTVHAENLQSMPKDELVKHYMSLEEKVAALQKKVAEAEHVSSVKQDDADMTVKTSSDTEKDFASDSASSSDSNSLSSGNEDFVDLSSVNQPAIDVGESDVKVKEK